MAFKPDNRRLLTAVTATGASVWTQIWPYEDVSIHVHGVVSGDIVKVEVSNEPDPDTPGSNFVQFGTDIITNDLVILTETARWMRVNVTAIVGGGPITVDMSGRIPG